MKYLEANKYHWQRRLIHLTIGIIAMLYYAIKDHISALLQASPKYWLSVIGVSIVLIEWVRLKNGWLFYGQREYEKNRPSAFVWTGLGLIFVFLFAPAYHGQDAAFAQPVIWSLVLGDPLLGECRRAGLSIFKTIAITVLILSLVWLTAALWYQFPFWLILLMPILAILGEWPQIRWIDDNFMMVFLPIIALQCFF